MQRCTQVPSSALLALPALPPLPLPLALPARPAPLPAWWPFPGRMAVGPVLLIAVVTVLALAPTPGAEARERAVDADALVPVELSGVGISVVNGAPLVLLRHLATGDVVPIAIGVDQARAILLAMHGVEPPRPMTHDLLVDLLDALDATLERVLVDDLVNNTYLAMLELRVPGAEATIRVDSRPSDALALAVRTGAGILVAPSVLVAGAGHGYEGLPGARQVLTALGITVIGAGPDEREALGLPHGDGVLVRRLVGAAARTDLRPGAFIRAVNDAEVATPMQFLEAVRDAADDAPVRIRFWQDGSEAELELDRGAGVVEPRGPVTRA